MIFKKKSSKKKVLRSLTSNSEPGTVRFTLHAYVLNEKANHFERRVTNLKEKFSSQSGDAAMKTALEISKSARKAALYFRAVAHALQREYKSNPSKDVLFSIQFCHGKAIMYKKTQKEMDHFQKKARAA